MEYQIIKSLNSANAFRIVLQPESDCLNIHLKKEELKGGGAKIAEAVLGVPDDKYPQGRAGGTQLVYGIERESVNDDNLLVFRNKMREIGFDQEE